jgi:cell division protein YceG involved in septum cleavage
MPIGAQGRWSFSPSRGHLPAFLKLMETTMNFLLILLVVIAGIFVWSVHHPREPASLEDSYSQQYIKCRDHYTASVVHTEKEKQQLINICTAFTSQHR